MGESSQEPRKLRPSRHLKSLVVAMILFPVGLFTLSVTKQVQAPSRGIASVGEPNSFNVDAAAMDLSVLSAADLKKTFKYQLLRDVHASRFEDSVSLNLGLFMVRNDMGTKVFVCDRYSNIEMTVQAGKNIRVIQSPCRISDDQNHIEATSLIENSGTTPMHITSLRLLGDSKEDVLEVSAKDLLAVLGQPIAVEDVH